MLSGFVLKNGAITFDRCSAAMPVPTRSPRFDKWSPGSRDVGKRDIERPADAHRIPSVDDEIQQGGPQMLDID
jgi:hypothetical protein